MPGRRLGVGVIPKVVEARTLNEGAMPRAWRDTWTAVKTVWFGLLVVVCSAFVAILTFGYINDPTNSDTARALMTGATVLMGFMGALGLVFLVLAVQTPFRQRYEAREQRDSGTKEYTRSLGFEEEARFAQ